MKISVRRKVANGLVLCLVIPKAATMASDVVNSTGADFDDFSAKDEFDLSTGKLGSSNQQADFTVNAVGADDPCDPSGFDPSGFTTTCVDDPSGGLPTFCYKAPNELVTAEDGSADLIEVYSEVDPSGTHFYEVLSSSTFDPSGGGALPDPTVVAFGADACEPQPVWVIGQNNGLVDDDQEFTIFFRNENDEVVGSVPGINLNNDDYPGVEVNIEGPATLPPGGMGNFDVLIQNLTRASLPDSDLFVESTTGLEINGFAAGLVGGGKFKAKGKIKNGVLMLEKFSLGPGETLLVTVQALLNATGPAGEKMTARIKDRARGGGETDDDWSTDGALP